MARASQSNGIATGAPNEIRMMLLGRTGAGKSAIGNSILGNKVFKSRLAAKSTTTICQAGTRDFGGKRLFVVDTPGFLDTNVKEEATRLEIGRAYEMTAVPGPHVFLLVFEPGKMTEQEDKAGEYLEDIFGHNAINHTIIIFTYGDKFVGEETSFADYLADLPEDRNIGNLIKQCQNRCLCFNNKADQAEKDKTTKILLDMIAQVVSSNINSPYVNEAFKAVASEVAEKKAEGTYAPIKPDGSFALLPKTKEIVVDGYLRRTVGR